MQLAEADRLLGTISTSTGFENIQKGQRCLLGHAPVEVLIPDHASDDLVLEFCRIAAKERIVSIGLCGMRQRKEQEIIASSGSVDDVMNPVKKLEIPFSVYDNSPLVMRDVMGKKSQEHGLAFTGAGGSHHL